MGKSILITGSEGLIGAALVRVLRARREQVDGFDIRATTPSSVGDVRCFDDVNKAVSHARGIVHLAAVSRVIFGERDPGLCEATNVGGTRNVLGAALAAGERPWVVVASSREVYGAPSQLPATEDSPLAPVNVYGRTKLAAERLVDDARASGLRAAVVRLSNVYGSTRDHRTRVVPAFARAAVLGEPLTIEGSQHTFDFTHLDDTVRGLVAMVELLDSGVAPPPPIHFLTGTQTSLGTLARACCAFAGSRSTLVEAPPRAFDVSRFYGDPSRAHRELRWTARVSLRDGIARLIGDFQRELRAPIAARSGR